MASQSATTSKQLSLPMVQQNQDPFCCLISNLEWLCIRVSGGRGSSKAMWLNTSMEWEKNWIKSMSSRTGFPPNTYNWLTFHIWPSPSHPATAGESGKLRDYPGYADTWVYEPLNRTEVWVSSPYPLYFLQLLHIFWLFKSGWQLCWRLPRMNTNPHMKNWWSLSRTIAPLKLLQCLWKTEPYITCYLMYTVGTFLVCFWKLRLTRKLNCANFSSSATRRIAVWIIWCPEQGPCLFYFKVYFKPSWNTDSVTSQINPSSPCNSVTCRALKPAAKAKAKAKATPAKPDVPAANPPAAKGKAKAKSTKPKSKKWSWSGHDI